MYVCSILSQHSWKSLDTCAVERLEVHSYASLSNGVWVVETERIALGKSLPSNCSTSLLPSSGARQYKCIPWLVDGLDWFWRTQRGNVYVLWWEPQQMIMDATRTTVASSVVVNKHALRTFKCMETTKSKFHSGKVSGYSCAPIASSHIHFILCFFQEGRKEGHSVETWYSLVMDKCWILLTPMDPPVQTHTRIGNSVVT